ncbi:hypothetical protein MQE36_15770 [Zhouia spongiae]|uniref:Uncharacterized protein n=1 Tax=Zhouia spongiae TaxID=2202721 RepID=A0ABY3YL77_9FLAO|nr:hypothetical protein [Zhouia spongiae]UNY98525.1 hypothetical protein MQE36_15770 [Zhouia spongiae]
MRIVNSFCKYVCLMIALVGVFGVETGTAQESRIYKFERTSEARLGSASVPGEERVSELAFQLQPCIYIENNNIKKVSGYRRPVVIKMSNSNSYNLLASPDSRFRNVELLKIDIENRSELRNTIDMSKLTGLRGLKYLFIDCSFEVSEYDIKRYVVNPDPEIIILYGVNKKS